MRSRALFLSCALGFLLTASAQAAEPAPATAVPSNRTSIPAAVPAELRKKYEMTWSRLQPAVPPRRRVRSGKALIGAEPTPLIGRERQSLESRRQPSIL